MRLKALIRLAGSRRLAVALTLAWMALIVVWVVPFEFYGLPDEQIRAVVYQEPFFQVVYAVLAINTVVCISVHAGSAVRRARRIPSSGSAPRAHGDAIPAGVAFSEPVARAALHARGYRSIVDGSSWAWGVRNRWSPLGTLVFHAGLLGCIVSLGLSFSPALRFEGSLVLAEGETYAGDPAAFIDIPDAAQADPVPLAFAVNDVQPRFYEDLLLFTALEADVSEGGRSHHVTLGSPWLPRADTLVTLTDFGYALEVVVSSEDATEAVNSIYRLKAFPSGQRDQFEVGAGASTYRVYVEVYGDYVDRDGVPGVASFNADNPYLLVSVARKLAASGERMLVDEALVPIGGSVSVPGAVFTFPGLRHYGVFRVTRSAAAPWMLGSLLLLSMGTVMRLAFPRTEALITLGSGSPIASVDVRSEVYGRRPELAAALAEQMESSS